MLTGPLLLAAALGVPAVVAGPDLAQTAVAVEAPITAVTVYSDRARVTRTARAPAGKGTIALRLPDLPGALALDSLRLTADGGRVVRVEANPVQRSRRSIDQVDALLNAIEADQDKALALAMRQLVLTGEHSLLLKLRPAPLPDLEDRDGKPGVIGAGSWTAVLDFIEGRLTEIDARRAEVDAEARDLNDGLRASMKALAEYDMAAFSAQRIQLIAIIERGASPVSLEAEYMVPGAKWTPVYAIERAPKVDRITVRTAGLVTQTTGEDWTDVAVTLSTAIPNARIGMPKMLTWTLGESRDFVLRPQPKQRGRPQRMTPVRAQKPVDELYADWSLAQLRGRVAQVRSDADANSFKDEDGMPDPMPSPPVTTRRVVSKIAPRRQQRPMPSAPPARPMQDNDQDAIMDSEDESTLLFSANVGLRGGADDMPIRSSATLQGMAGGFSGANISGRMQNRRMGLLDNRVIGRGPVGPAGSPARIAGGLDYRYRATTRMTLKSSPEAQRVPLAVEAYPTTPFYATAPGIQTVAFLKATVKNQSGRPLLAGPVNIFVGTDFIGQGMLATTGAGDTLDLPLGADEDIKITRRVLPKTKTEGVFSSDDVTHYTTIIEIGNFKATPIRIRVREQVPLSGHDKVKLTVGSFSPKPVEGPGKQGLMAFDLNIAPGKTETIRFDYTVTRPENWKLRQF